MTKISISEDIKKEAVSLVDAERSNWETATAQLTKNIRMDMRKSIEQYRKNYYGIFDTDDKNKVWIPITEQAVEDTIKNFDLDQKDIRFRGANKNAIKETEVVRAVVKNDLDKKFFGEDLDKAERDLAIDGTVVWKLYEGKDEYGKKGFQYDTVDLLNFYIDPHAESIQKTPAVIERIPMELEDFRRLPELVDTEEVEGSERIAMTGSYGVDFTSGQTKMVEVFERWGEMPEYFITGKKPKDGEEVKMIQGRIVTTGYGDGAKVHLIAKNNKPFKPYEECWYTRVKNRWYGRGVAEKVYFLQLWANMVKNIHITRQRMTQLGLFKVKKGSGVTPQMLKKLPVSGAITVNKMDDIENFVMQEASMSSYKDMDDIDKWVQSITSAVSTISPESLSSSMPATTSVINDRNNKSTFTLIREGIGMWLQRIMSRHALPIILKNTSSKDLIAISGSAEEVDKLLEQMAVKEAYKTLKQSTVVPTEEELKNAINKAKQKLKDGGDIMIELSKKYEAGNFNPYVYVTNEEMDVAVTVQNLLAILPTSPEYKESIIRNVFDLLGLPQPTAQQMQQQPQQGGKAGDVNPATSEQEINTKARTNVGTAV